MQFLDQPIEGQVLMAVRTQTYFSNPPEDFPKSRIAGKVGPQDQRVDEEPDQPFGFQPVTVGDRRPDDQVVLARVAIQQDRERR